MSKVQKLLIPALAGAMFLASTAVELPSSPLVFNSGGSSKSGDLHKPDAPGTHAPSSAAIRPVVSAGAPGDADVVLRQAAAAYALEKIAWLELTLWQRAAFGELEYRMEGRYLGAPHQLLRLELRLQAGPLAGKLLLISDGKVLHEKLQLPGETDRINDVPLPEAQDGADNPAASAGQREAFLSGKSFRGIGPLLQQIQQNLRRRRLTVCTWNGQKVLEIRGEWDLGEKVAECLPPELHLGQVVRECRLYLDAATYWPVRVEWWGSRAAGQPRVLLVETEYRNPVVNQSLSLERMTREFSVLGGAW